MFHLGIAWIMSTDISWTLMALYLNIADVLGRFFVSSVEVEIAAIGGAAFAIVAVIMVYVMNFWIFIAILAIFGFRIVGIIGLTPVIPAIFAARALPIQGLSSAMDSLWHLWVYIVVIPLPVAAVMAVGFGGDTSQILSQAGITGGLIVVALQVGTLVAAIFLPYAMYKKASYSALGPGVANGIAIRRLRKRYSEQSDATTDEKGGESSDSLRGRARQRLSGARDSFRGARRGGRNIVRGARGKETAVDAEGQHKLRGGDSRAHAVGAKARGLYISRDKRSERMS
jgi:hypothetical protein